jgi:glutamate synthase domain-containing protein 3
MMKKGISRRTATAVWWIWKAVDDAEEKLWLQKWIERHQQYTGSELAEKLLKNWDDVLVKFVKVMPIEYRAVLEKMEKESGSCNEKTAA